MVGAVRIANERILREPHKGSAVPEPRGAPARRAIELSHPIEHGMITYPGLPGTGDLRSSEPRGVADPTTRRGRSSRSGASRWWRTPARTWTRPSTGTGRSRAVRPAGQLANLEGIVVRVGDAAGRGRSTATAAPATTWPRTSGAVQPVGTVTGAPRLRRRGAPPHAGRGALARPGTALALVGIDSVNIDDIGDGRASRAQPLLGAGIPIVEHLCALDQLPPRGFRFHAAPPRVRGMGTFPVRAYAITGA